METLEHLDADSETDAISDIQPVQNVTPNVRTKDRKIGYNKWKWIDKKKRLLKTAV